MQRDANFLKELHKSPDNQDQQILEGVPKTIKPVHLEELIESQKRTHVFFREQLQLADQRYAALCSSFDDERKRLEREAAQGDDVVAMLEKERERLQVEVSFY